MDFPKPNNPDILIIENYFRPKDLGKPNVDFCWYARGDEATKLDCRL